MTTTRAARKLPAGITQLPSGSWLVTVSRPGQPRLREVYAEDRLTEAVAFKAQQEALKRSGGRAARLVRHDEMGAITVRAYYAEWIARRSAPNASDPIQATTARGYRASFGNWILPNIGSVPLRDLTPAVGARLDDAMGALKPSSRRQVLVALRAMLDDARVRGVACGEAIPAARKARGKRADAAERRHAISPDEAQKLISAAWHDWEEVLYLVLWSTGARIAEASALTFGDVDLEQRRIRIWRQWSAADGYRAPKSGKARYAPISAQLEAVLRPLMADADPRGTIVQIGGKPVPVWTAGSSFVARRAELKLHDAVLHSFRHGAITHWLASGVPVTMARDWAGHASLAVTNTYAHSVHNLHSEYAALL